LDSIARTSSLVVKFVVQFITSLEYFNVYSLFSFIQKGLKSDGKFDLRHLKICDYNTPLGHHEFHNILNSIPNVTDIGTLMCNVDVPIEVYNYFQNVIKCYKHSLVTFILIDNNKITSINETIVRELVEKCPKLTDVAITIHNDKLSFFEKLRQEFTHVSFQ
jgi:hypothetical protein